MASLPPGAVNLIISGSVLCALASVFVVLRFVSIFRVGRRVRIHDWLTVVALIAMYGQAVCAMIGAKSGGLGLHILEVFFSDPAELVVSGKIVFIASLFWLVSTLAFRSAILVLYLELFGSSLAFRYCCRFLQAIVVLFFIGGVITNLGLCYPIQRSWDRTVPGHCGDGNTALLASAIIGTILDIVTVVLPLPIVWRLQMAVQKKVAITATFALGFSICGINVARMVVTEVCDADDFTYCTPYSLIFVLCEMAGGILVACIPTLGPIVFPQRYQTRNAGGSAWRQIDGYRPGRVPRIVITAMSDQDILADDSAFHDSDFLDPNESYAGSKEKTSNDFLDPKRRSSTTLHAESKGGKA